MHEFFVSSLAMIATDFDWSTLTYPALWFGVLVAAILIESATADLVAVWFAPGAFIAMILAFLEVDPIIQIVVAASVTVLCLILTKTVFKKYFRRHNRIEKTNADALEGKLALVEEDIDNLSAAGVAKINGQLWTARMEDPNDKPVKGEWVEIVRVEGAKLICRPKA